MRRWKTMLYKEELLTVGTFLRFPCIVKVVVLKWVFMEYRFTDPLTLVWEWLQFSLRWRAIRAYRTTIFLRCEVFIFQNLFLLFLLFTFFIEVLSNTFVNIWYIWKILKLRRVKIMHWIWQAVDFTLFFSLLAWLQNLRNLIDRLCNLLKPHRSETVNQGLRILRSRQLLLLLRLQSLLLLKPSKVLMISVHLFESSSLHLLLEDFSEWLWRGSFRGSLEGSLYYCF